jgi:LysM repeat protein
MRTAYLRAAAPAVFLAAVTAAVLLARSALHRTPVSAAVASPAPRAYYRLLPGDTLPGLARRFRTTVHRLRLFNPGLDAQGLVPGQKLRVR